MMVFIHIDRYSLGDCYLTLMLLVANLANTKRCEKPKNMTETLENGTHLRLLSESY